MAETLVAPPKSAPGTIRTPEEVLKNRLAHHIEPFDGIFQGEVWSRITYIDTRLWWLDVIVPELDGFIKGILNVHTPLDTPYPAVVDAELFDRMGLARYHESLKPLPVKQANWADDADELAAIVDAVFRSPSVSASLERLAARVLEQRKAA